MTSLGKRQGGIASIVALEVGLLGFDHRAECDGDLGLAPAIGGLVLPRPATVSITLQPREEVVDLALDGEWDGEVAIGAAGPRRSATPIRARCAAPLREGVSAA